MASKSAIIARKTAQVLLIAGSLALLGVTAFRTWANVIDHADEMPKFFVTGDTWSQTYRKAKRFPEQFETFFDRRVAWRDIQVRRFARNKMDRLGVSSTPRVWLGSDGWLFFNHEADASYLAANDPALDKRLHEWEVALPEWQSWLQARGIRLLVVIAPDKQSIYTEHLPDFARKSRPDQAPIDRLIAKLPGVDVLDLREPLRAAKGTEPLFYHNDTHWNPRGVRVGYQATTRRLGIEPRKDDDFYITGRLVRDGDLAFRLLGYWPHGDEFFDDLQLKSPTARSIDWNDADDGSRLDYLHAEAWERSNPLDGKCLLFHDSFGHSSYARLLAEHFTKLVAVPSNHMDPKLIEQENPNVVILELVERLFQGTGARRPTDPPRSSVTR